MPEQKMTYEERLDKTARKIHAAGTCYAPYSPQYRGFDNEVAARDEIKRQADAIRDFANNCEFVEFLNHTSVDAYLLEHGYIDPKTEEDEKK